jgi:hypothetical protein
MYLIKITVACTNKVMNLDHLSSQCPDHSRAYPLSYPVVVGALSVSVKEPEHKPTFSSFDPYINNLQRSHSFYERDPFLESHLLNQNFLR